MESPACHVRTVSDRRTLKDFLRLPRKIYKDDPFRVNPLEAEVRRTLDPQRNPYFRNASLRLFLCYRNGSPVARGSVVINALDGRKHGEKTAMFGFFESVNEARSAASLFDEIERYCQTEGVKTLEGPFNPNHYSELGLQVNGFGSVPMFFQPYNPPYYRGLLEAVGFSPVKRLVTARNDDIRNFLRLHFQSPSPRTLPGYTIRPLRLNDFDAEMERIRFVFNDAFADNWHFLPSSREEYIFGIPGFRMITRPDLVRIVEREGTPVAALILVLDVNPMLKTFDGRLGLLKAFRFFLKRGAIDRAIVYAVGIRKEYQRSRVVALLVNAAAEMLEGFRSVGTTWMSEEHHLSTRLAERFGMVRDKEFLIFAKDIAPARVTQA